MPSSLNAVVHTFNKLRQILESNQRCRVFFLWGFVFLQLKWWFIIHFLEEKKNPVTATTAQGKVSHPTTIWHSLWILSVSYYLFLDHFPALTDQQISTSPNNHLCGKDKCAGLTPTAAFFQVGSKGCNKLLLMYEVPEQWFMRCVASLSRDNVTEDVRTWYPHLDQFHNDH